ncbi:hypothetical protein, partial [Nocardiopsis trehalosi]|uniref:hypothetical protein n=1 Tax=Nocardiopsis trehalosi TaxID=109329 RepID=UPI000A69CB11
GLPEDSFTAGARLNFRAGLGYRVRTTALGVSGSSTDYYYTELGGPPEAYDADLAATMTLTPPAAAPDSTQVQTQPRTQTGAQTDTAPDGTRTATRPDTAPEGTRSRTATAPDGAPPARPEPISASWDLPVRLFVPGGPGTNPPDTPERITLADPRDPATADVPGPGARAVDRSYPVHIGGITTTTPQGAMSLADWARDRLLGYDSKAAANRPSPAPDAGGHKRLTKKPPEPSKRFHRHNDVPLKGLADGSLVQGGLNTMTTGYTDLPFLDSGGGDRRLRITSSPTDYRRLPTPPKAAEFSTLTRVSAATGETRTKTSFWNLLFSGGADFRVTDRMFRFAPALLEYLFRKNTRQISDTRQDSSGRSPLMWGDPDTVLYEVTRTYYAQFDGDPRATRFTGTTYELFTAEDARLLGTADVHAPATEAAPSPDPSAPT